MIDEKISERAQIVPYAAESAIFLLSYYPKKKKKKPYNVFGWAQLMRTDEEKSMLNGIGCMAYDSYAVFISFAVWWCATVRVLCVWSGVSMCWADGCGSLG